MKYIFILPIKCFISLLWVLMSLVAVIIFQVVDIFWNGRFKYIFPMKLFSISTNTIFDDDIDPQRVYPTVWHWISNGNFHNFK